MRHERHVPTEEILEEIWTLSEEEGRVTVERLRAASKMPIVEETLDALFAQNAVRRENGLLFLTPEGEREAREIVRRNRLTSVLMTELFEIEREEAEEVACELEHVLNRRVTESICTLLGHPPHTADGRRIPRGKCCENAAREVCPIVRPLADITVGRRARVVFIVPSAAARLQRLAGLGLAPGGVLRLDQTKPAFVVEVGETTLALDASLAKEIYVKEI